MTEPQYYQTEIKLLEELWLKENDYPLQWREDMYTKLDAYKNGFDCMWFETIDDLIEDHKKLKESIKKREITTDAVVKQLGNKQLDWDQLTDAITTLDDMSWYMMSVNM